MKKLAKVGYFSPFAFVLTALALPSHWINTEFDVNFL